MSSEPNSPDNASNAAPQSASRYYLNPYLAAIGLLSLAFAIRWFLNPLLGNLFPFFTFFLSVVLITIYGGIKPALLTALAGYLLGEYFFLNQQSLWPRNAAGWFGTAFYWLTNGVVIWFGETRGRALRQAKEEAQRSARAEQAALAHEAALDATIRSIGEGVIVTDANGRITLMNTVAEKMTGWTQAEAEGRGYLEVFRILEETTRDPIESPVEKVRQEESAVRFTTPTLLVTKDRGEIPIDVSGAPVRDTKGNFAGTVLVFRDITERRAAEQRLAESEAFSRSVLESSGDSIKVLNLEARLLAMNSAARTLMEMDDVENVEGSDWLSLWKGETAEAAKRAIEAARAGQDGRFQGFRPTVRGTPKYWDVLISPVLDAEGRPVRLVTVARDITVDRQREQALKESEERFRTLTDNMAQLAWMADETGWLFWYNQRWFNYTGTTLDEMEGWGWQKVHHPDHLERVTTKFMECVRNGEFWEDTFPLRSKEGPYRWFLSRAIPIRDETGRVVRWFGTNTDVDDIRRAQAEIEALNARLHRGMSETHHRIRNNLQVISAMVDMQTLNAGETIPTRAMERIGSHVQTLVKLHELLTQEARNHTELDFVSAKATLEKLHPLLQKMVGDRKIILHAEEISIGIREAASLCILVNELVSNSAKHGHGDICLMLTLDSSENSRETSVEQRARLEVCDAGPGFPDGFQPPFAGQHGMELIESAARWDLNGEITYANRAEGGACVTVTFPLPAISQAP